MTEPRTVHKVSARQLDRYECYLQETVQANCGVIFAPLRPLMITPEMPKCKVCFPKRPRFAWAA